MESVIRDDAEVLAMWREAMKPAPGRNQHSSDDNVNDAPTPKGNSRAYTVARLQKQNPGLFEEVKAGRMSANAAAIAAGIVRVKTATHEKPRHREAPGLRWAGCKA